MTMNTSSFNTIVAEAMDEIKGVWEAEYEQEQRAIAEWEAECEEYEYFGQATMRVRDWLFEHIAEYETEAYDAMCGYYSDIHKEWCGCRPHGFWTYLREAYEEYLEEALAVGHA